MKTVRLLLFLSLAAGACFDVKPVELPPFTIDDFDDDDLAPSNTRFLPWTCRSFGNAVAGTAEADPDPGTPLDCRVEAVGTHPHAMTMPFRVDDPPDGQRQLGGATIETQTPTVLDLGQFERLVFAATLESAVSPLPTLPAGTQLRVEIACDRSMVPTTLEQVVPNIVIGSDWAPFRLDLVEFAPALPGCLHQIDAIRFSVRPGLSDGQSAIGALHLDNIYFE